MPSTRPRTSRVRTTYAQPSITPRSTPTLSSAGIAAPAGTAPRSPTNSRPETANATATAYIVSSAGDSSSQPAVECSASPRMLSPAKSTADGSAAPYVVVSTSRLAASSRSRGTRLGTVASLLGSHTRLTISTRTVATSSHGRVPTSGMLAKMTARRNEPTTSVTRRSSRSAR